METPESQQAAQEELAIAQQAQKQADQDLKVVEKLQNTQQTGSDRINAKKSS